MPALSRSTPIWGLKPRPAAAPLSVKSSRIVSVQVVWACAAFTDAPMASAPNSNKDRAKIDIPLTLPKIGRTIADGDEAATARPGALQWRISPSFSRIGGQIVAARARCGSHMLDELPGKWRQRVNVAHTDREF